MTATVQLGDLTVSVVRKEIKNVHLSVHPPTGRVTISAPARMSLDTIRVFAISKIRWIRQQQKKLLEQERETPREFLNRESHYLWGRRYLLKVIETDGPTSIAITPSALIMHTRPGWDQARKQEALDAWYREQIRSAAPPLIEKWERLMDVKISRFFVQHMKTKWGSCNPRSGTIRLNTELAKKPRACVEYIIVHELTHLLEPTHNARFIALMDQFMPKWQAYRQTLNRLPVRHESWGY